MQLVWYHGTTNDALKKIQQDSDQHENAMNLLQEAIESLDES